MNYTLSNRNKQTKQQQTKELIHNNKLMSIYISCFSNLHFLNKYQDFMRMIFLLRR